MSDVTHRIHNQINGERLEIVFGVSDFVKYSDNLHASLKEILCRLRIHSSYKAATFLNVKVQVFRFVIGNAREI